MGAGGRALLSWLTCPETCSPASGVVVLPPIGYPYWSSHRTLRVLSEQLASKGHLVLRLDYESIGDSAGTQWEGGRVDAWRRSALTAARELRLLGCRSLTVVGIQLGGLIALLDGPELGAETVIAWEPIVSGRRYTRELRVRSHEYPPAELVPGVEEALVSVGTIFTSETLADLVTLDATALEEAPAGRVLLVGGAAHDALADHLRSLGAETDDLVLAGGETALESPTEEAVVPEAIVGSIAGWIGAGHASGGQPPPVRTEARFRWGRSDVAERVLELGADGLVGVMTEPADPAALRTDAATVVFMNSGSEAHTGSGRVWVDYARGLSAAGHRALRVDYRGWGESPDGGYAPGRPYMPHCEDDAVAIVNALRSAGYERIVLAGLCASAWVALKAILRVSVSGVFAINPQMYWRQGDPREATIQETSLRRTKERARHRRGARLGLWSALDLIGHRSVPAEWLDQVAATKTPVTMMFAEGDPGIEFLRLRLGRRLGVILRGGSIDIVEIPEIDHSMHYVWRRPAVLATLIRAIDTTILAADGL
jgi:alpha/beta superfamily hydrolase